MQQQQQHPTKRHNTIKAQPSVNTSIEWILNLIDTFPKYELQQTNMKVIPSTQVERIQHFEALNSGKIYSYNGQLQKFSQMNFILYPNMLVSTNDEEKNLQNASYLILSTCTLEKKIIQYKEFQAQGLIAYNHQGQTYLFFESYMQLTQWHKLMKRFSKLKNFLMKFTVKERQNVPNVFACVKNKNNRVYTVQIFRQNDLMKNPAVNEALQNEIHILMTFKHAALLQYFSLYEDQQHLYILYEYWVGDPLYKLIVQGLKLNSSQIANIIFQIIKLIKFLHQSSVYHCLITPQNIIVLRNYQNQNTPGVNQYKIVVMGFGFREESQQNWNWLQKRLIRQWTPPEINQKVLNNDISIVIDPYKVDSYQIGCTLYYLLQYKPQLAKHTIPLFHKTVEQFNIKFEDLLDMQKKQALEFNNDDGSFTQSQLNLLVGLLQPDIKKRLLPVEASKHHWFVNEKSKATIIHTKPKILPSLKTILELRELSSQELNSRFEVDASNLSLNSNSESEEEEIEDINAMFLQEKVSEEKCQLFKFVNSLNSVNSIKHPSKHLHENSMTSPPYTKFN